MKLPLEYLFENFKYRVEVTRLDPATFQVGAYNRISRSTIVSEVYPTRALAINKAFDLAKRFDVRNCPSCGKASYECQCAFDKEGK